MRIPSGRRCAKQRRTSRIDDGQTRMIRSITVAAILGALVAGVAAYTISPSVWLAAIGLRSGGLEQTAQANLASEEWPICTMTVAMPDADWARLDPEFAAGKK